MMAPNIQPPMKPGDPIPSYNIGTELGIDGTLWTLFDFRATYPLREVSIDETILPDDGIHVTIEYSLSKKEWQQAPNILHPSAGSCGSLNDVLTRYVRISGLAWEPGDDSASGSISFLAGIGLAAEPADEWTRLLHRSTGWSGADGIYSIPCSGVEAYVKDESVKTLLLFGDTFIGDVDEATGGRLPSLVMLNNSFALLEGTEPEPEKIRFLWNEQDGVPVSVILPSTSKALSEKGSYYWLQDGTCVDGVFHCYPLIIGPNPDGPEGFQFAVHGITHVFAPMSENGPIMDKQIQEDTSLYYQTSDNHTAYFGGAIMPNTSEAHALHPDGFVYVYGLLQDGSTKLIAARVPAANLSQVECWTYWNGSEWTDIKEAVAPIVPEVSSEFSVAPMTGGFLDQEFVIAYMQGGITGGHIVLYRGNSPVGPFGAAIPVYFCSEAEEGDGIYVYNAKGHPHLSRDGELLVSYNVNTTSMDAHMSRADIYRPRFIRIRQIM